MLISPITKKWMNGFIAKPKVALLIDCPDDLEAGMKIANFIYKELVQEKNNPAVIISMKDKKSIGIDDIKDIKHSLSLRANKKKGISRFVIVEDASKMTMEAQNSLLKIIEELPDNTLIALVVPENNSILETIKSRCFTLPVLPISKTQALQFASSKGVDKVLATKLFALSEGRSSNFESSLNKDNDKGIEEIELAKRFLSSNIIDRQKIIEEVTQKDHDPIFFLNALKLTAKAGMYNSKSKEAVDKWRNIVVSIIRTEVQVKQNVANKLALLSLSVSI